MERKKESGSYFFPDFFDELWRGGTRDRGGTSGPGRWMWQPGPLSLPALFFLSAVHQVSRGLPVKWTWTNVARRPAATVPFAKILLIATCATAGQVSRSRIPLISQFTGNPTLDMFWFFFPFFPQCPSAACSLVSDAAGVLPSARPRCVR